MSLLKSSKYFENSLKIFDWLSLGTQKDSVKGTDIDFVFHMNDKFIILEGKFIQNGVFYVNWSQYKTIKSIIENRGYGFFVGLNKDNENEIYVMNILRISDNWSWSTFKQPISINNCTKMTKQQFRQYLLILTDDFYKVGGRKNRIEG